MGKNTYDGQVAGISFFIWKITCATGGGVLKIFSIKHGEKWKKDYRFQ